MSGEEIVGGSIRTEILRRLRAAEIEHDVRILYACESGSRAWGFASPDSEQVRLKKYFYVLRPLLAIRYIEQGMGVPPVEFSRLLESVLPQVLRPSINRLLELKRNTEEFGYGPRVPEINRFVEQELERHGSAFSGQGRPEVPRKEEVYAQLNQIFRAAIRSDAA